MRVITQLMASMGHEQVVFVAEREVGLRALIAIHSTALGPALGGVRFWQYASEHDAMVDALRLSEAMTLKAAMAGLHQGGGKTVVMWDDPDRAAARRAAATRSGRAIDELGGRYLAAEDVGATTKDMNGLADATPWVTGVDESLGGSGDPSPVTAYGVVHAMHAVRDHARRRAVPARPPGRRPGVGARRVASRATARGRRRRGRRCRTSSSRARGRAPELGVEHVGIDATLVTQCDFLAPCALGDVFDDESIPQLRCRAIVGAANNQLGVDRCRPACSPRAASCTCPTSSPTPAGSSTSPRSSSATTATRALAHAAEIETTTARVLAAAADLGITPLRAAEHLARARLAEEGAGRPLGTGRSRRMDERRTPRQTPPVTPRHATCVSWGGYPVC